MADSLSQAFKGYAVLVQATLGDQRIFDERLRAMGILLLFPEKKIDFLPSVVKQLEQEEQFNQLLKETRSAFSEQYPGPDDSWTRSNIKNFFRRSSFYLSAFEGTDSDVESTFEKYMLAFQKQEITVESLSLLEGVDFDCPDSGMHFQNFQIRRFSEAELAEKLENRVSQVFYPPGIDVYRLQDYWFISTTCSKPRLTPSRLFDIWDSNFHRLDWLEPEYKRLAEELPFGSPQQILALFPWQKDIRTGQEEWAHWAHGVLSRYYVPFVLQVDNDLLSPPSPAPDLAVLRVHETSNQAEIWIELDDNRTDQFKTFVEQVEHLFGALRPQECGFLAIALAYFMKAFQSTGLEQLLWHIISLEALLGEKGQGVTKRLARRISMILGSTGGEREKIQEEFIALHKCRNDFVHGNEFGQEVPVTHLTTARSFARETLLWFLHYVYAARPKTGENQESASILSREVLLKCLDGDTQQSLRQLMGIFPPGFPHVPTWLE